MTRRNRHGRSLRSGAGTFPSSTVGVDRVAAIAAAAAERLAQLTSAGAVGSSIPAFEVVVDHVPTRGHLDRSNPGAVADGALLAGHDNATDGTVLITVFARPLLLWSDGTTASVTTLVRHALAQQLASAVGLDADQLDPEVE